MVEFFLPGICVAGRNCLPTVSAASNTDGISRLPNSPQWASDTAADHRSFGGQRFLGYQNFTSAPVLPLIGCKVSSVS